MRSCGRVKGKQPSTLMCSCCSGESRRRSSSAISRPVARSWALASSRHSAFQSTSALSAKPSAPSWSSWPLAVGLAQLAFVPLHARARRAGASPDPKHPPCCSPEAGKTRPHAGIRPVRARERSKPSDADRRHPRPVWSRPSPVAREATADYRITRPEFAALTIVLGRPRSSDRAMRQSSRRSLSPRAITAPPIAG
jgi:hypothetical protein